MSGKSIPEGKVSIDIHLLEHALKRMHLFLHEEDQISESMVQDTFYTYMYEAVSTMNYISKQSLQTRDAFVYLALSGHAIVSCLQNNPNDAFLLVNGRKVTLENCPTSFQLILRILLHLKPEFQQLTELEIDIVRICVTQDPDQKIPSSPLITSSLMRFVSKINSLSIQISTLPNFKKVIEHVISMICEEYQ